MGAEKENRRRLVELPSTGVDGLDLNSPSWYNTSSFVWHDEGSFLEQVTWVTSLRGWQLVTWPWEGVVPSKTLHFIEHNCFKMSREISWERAWLGHFTMRAVTVHSTISSPDLTCLWLETWRWWLRTWHTDTLVDSTQDNGSNGSDWIGLTADLTNIEKYRSQRWVSWHNGRQ